jgi:tetrahydromethanopterin S-methyltransferase subunit F
MRNFFDKDSFLPASYALIAKNTGLISGLQMVQRIFGLAAT